MHNAFNGLFAKIGCSGSQASRRLREELGDARTLLIGTAGTMISAWPSLLGLSIVALQVASSHYSPRLLGNFLHDRHNQVVLGVFVATFACNTAGLYIVGMSGGRRVEEFPRLTGTGAILLLFASLGFLVYFIDHLAHSIQFDTMTDVVQQNASVVLAHLRTPARLER